MLDTSIPGKVHGLMLLSSMYVVPLTQESEHLLQLLFQGNETYIIITLKFSCIGIGAYIVLAVAGHGNIVLAN
jgi:hypothetical protein